MQPVRQNQEFEKNMALPLAPSIGVFEGLLLDLVGIPSETGKEQAVALALESFLRTAFPDAQVTRQHITEDRWNVIMEKGTPQVTLTTHIDVVPGGPNAYVTPTAIVGRGACDAKGQVVTQLWGLSLALQQGVQSYRCAFVVGEEVDAVGARALLELPITPYLLNGEPTENQFVSRSWGAFEIELSSVGTSAHSSLGTADSAIHKLISELSVLLAKQPDGVSLNVGTIRGGLASNIQAPSASCDICARIRSDGSILEEFLNQTLTQSTWRAKSEPIGGLELFVPPSERGNAIEVKFASDCSVYATRYPHVILFGPGTIRDAHTDNESISREALREGAQKIARLLVELEKTDSAEGDMRNVA